MTFPECTAGSSARSGKGPDAPGPDAGNLYFETGAPACSGEGLSFGYISLVEAIQFVKLASDNIKEQADTAGVDLITAFG